jgi:hypothetical protein
METKMTFDEYCEEKKIRVWFSWSLDDVMESIWEASNACNDPETAALYEKIDRDEVWEALKKVDPYIGDGSFESMYDQFDLEFKSPLKPWSYVDND